MQAGVGIGDVSRERMYDNIDVFLNSPKSSCIRLLLDHNEQRQPLGRSPETNAMVFYRPHRQWCGSSGVSRNQR